MDRRSRCSRWLVVVGLSVSLWSQTASAHGREQAVTDVVFDPSDPQTLWLRGTFGLLLSRNAGQTFVFRCPGAVRFNAENEDPALAVDAQGVLWAGTFSGLAQTSGNTCAFTWNADVPREFVTDIELVGERRYAIASPGNADNKLWVADAAGAPLAHFTVRFTESTGVLLDRLVVAPSDPNTLYMSGATPPVSGHPRELWAFRSTDAGLTFIRTQVATVHRDERALHVLAVDPTNPARAFFRVVVIDNAATQERLLETRDGGQTFSEVHRAASITAATIVGRELWLATSTALVRAALDTATLSFAPVTLSQPFTRFRCLVRAPAGELYFCARNGEQDIFVGRFSVSDAQNVETVWTSRVATGHVGCACDTPVGQRCAAELTDYFVDLGRAQEPFTPECVFARDTGMEPEPPPGGGCRCSASGQSRSRMGWFAVAFLSLLVWRARRHG